ncbi:hypothetical protein PFICI_02521 [Pestalotiopsis fici W106-1]|uniref:NB-ARC domain-containing protein n=1 Tax=Pestalotiopsis fici (strain W106-1 / CGMCC3.15140) TaxID=1229662 RepID=W3XGZ2_PESFW|nr:uncharacterized protein PFICI_02521 [Pestalotiopsis fici W106-1]ETS84496.1 hypothetical protein PFICI_02521 [Pestalotiopsis fici W106-1]
MKRRQDSEAASYAAATNTPSTSNLDPKIYTVAWIAPLEIEAQAALHMLERRHRGRFPVSRGDDYVFHAGEIGGHNIVIATLPAGQEYGTGSAAALASQLKRFFPNLWFGLLVGVAAGLPDLSCRPPRDIRLGDVLVGLPEGKSAGLVAYDLGKETENGFQPLRYGHVLAITEPIVRSAIGSIKIEAPNEAPLFLPYFEAIRKNEHANGTFDDPGQDRDVLYISQAGGASEPIERAPRPPSKRTRVWYGPIGSGDKLLKSSQKRNELRDKYGVIGVEMEAAGTLNRIPVGVIRGVCDYGDHHKNKEWQPYAAAMASAYAKAVICQIPPAMGATQSHIAVAHPAKGQLVPEDVDATEAGPAFEVFHNLHQSIPLSRNPRFTGRSEVLDELEQRLFTERQCSAMAIVGLGGMGKTQVALHFAYRIQERYQDYSIFWVAAVSESTFEQSYSDIAGNLGLRKKNDKGINQPYRGTATTSSFQNGIKEESDVKKIVYHYLCSSSAGKWLLVLDNADDQELMFGSAEQPGIIEHLPKSESGRILMTTRSREVATDFAQFDVINLKEMNPTDSISLFSSSLIEKANLQDESLVVALLGDLAYLPLAITQAAAYLNRTQMPLQKYLNLLRGAENDMITLLSREFKDNTRYPNSRNAVATTWLISFDQIQKSNEDAINLLYLVSCIESKAIPQSIFPDSQSMETEEAIAVLCGYSFLTRRGSSDIFDMHSLVHVAIQVWRDKHHKTEQAFTQTISHLTEIINYDQRSNQATRRKYLPHALSALHGSDDCKIKPRYVLCIKVGNCLFEEDRIRESIERLEEACEWASGPLNNDQELRLACQCYLAAVYTYSRRPELAIAMLEPAVESMGPTDHRKSSIEVRLQFELAKAYGSRLRTKEAIDMLESLMKSRKEMNPDDQSEFDETLVFEQELARAYYHDGQMQKTIELCELVVDARERILLKTDLALLKSRNNLGMAYLNGGQTQKGMELLESVLETKEALLPKTHIELLITRQNLGIACLQNGQNEKAIALIEAVVAGMVTTLGEGDPETLKSQRFLARAYLQDGQSKRAMALFENLVGIYQRVSEKENLERLLSQRDLAWMYLEEGQVRPALHILEQITTVEQEILADDHPERLASLDLLRKARERLKEKDIVPPEANAEH